MKGFNLVSQRANISGECPRIKDSTLQKMERIPRILGKERFSGLVVFVTLFGFVGFLLLYTSKIFWGKRKTAIIFSTDCQWQCEPVNAWLGAEYSMVLWFSHRKYMKGHLHQSEAAANTLPTLYSHKRKNKTYPEHGTRDEPQLLFYRHRWSVDRWIGEAIYSYKPWGKSHEITREFMLLYDLG